MQSLTPHTHPECQGSGRVRPQEMCTTLSCAVPESGPRNRENGGSYPAWEMKPNTTYNSKSPSRKRERQVSASCVDPWGCKWEEGKERTDSTKRCQLRARRESEKVRHMPSQADGRVDGPGGWGTIS